MSIRLSKSALDKVVTVEPAGRLSPAEYESFVPELRSVVRDEGFTRLLLKMDSFLGWEPEGPSRPFPSAEIRLPSVEKVALIVDDAWDRTMAQFCRPFTEARIRYFDLGDTERAWNWIAA